MASAARGWGRGGTREAGARTSGFRGYLGDREVGHRDSGAQGSDGDAEAVAARKLRDRHEGDPLGGGRDGGGVIRQETEDTESSRDP